MRLLTATAFSDFVLLLYFDFETSTIITLSQLKEMSILPTQLQR